ncbi:unnamed protein product [Cyclocybe aegerita]|uniref:dolichyl-P-Glc:Man9GlcNAc2-PP-dolichol alpha-1,3-glucosyltransferase n=1 Tax=Cyclocybe aegerita TaxID=1973307 RepID=A0A8S0VXY7_CYCAE|nr:unnamed protein product [Cyclocybe aegerita]
MSKATKRLSRARPASLQQFQLNQGVGVGQGYGSQDGYTNPSPVTTRRGESPSLSVGGYEGQVVDYGQDGQSVSVGDHQNYTEHKHPYHPPPDSPTIHAPTPRRHLLDTSASQHWLHTPPLSPSLSAISSRSRPVSPLAYTHHTAVSTTSQSQNPSANYTSNYGPSYGYAGFLNERVLAYQKQQQLLQFPGLSQHQGSSSTSLSSSTSAFPVSSSGAGMGSATLRKRLSTQSFSAGGGPGHSRSFSALLEHEQMVHQKQQRRGSGSSVQGSVRGGFGLGVGGGGVGVKETEEPGMGRRWVRWMHKRGLRAWVVPAILGAGALVRLGIGLGSYSGEATPPMYGDYEAQRHWMELTVHLPMREWYTYDLQYWGLDYPPLTAYVSWICGVIAHSIDPSWVALYASRGLESASSKLFMRLSVLAFDTLVYLPALLGFVGIWHAARSPRTREVALLTLVLQPALLLVDFGHFQYNSVMLGFTLLAMNAFASGADLLGAVFFVLSLGFKQMALYYAPAVGSYLLAKCLYLGPKEGTRLFTSLALTTLLTFSLLFSLSLQPLLAGPIHRTFPFTRGLFEDKVANFWCASNVVLKWRKWAAQGALVRLSAGLTALGFLPAVLGMGRAGWVLGRGGWFAKGEEKEGKEKVEDVVKEEKEKAEVFSASEPPPFLPLLPYALLTSAMSFFLFSFQVHEKTILVPLLPMTLLLSGAPVDSPVYEWGMLANNIGVFSMWPLLKRDGLGVQYIALLALWNRVVGHHPVRMPKSFVQLLSTVVYIAAFSLHLLELVANPPQRYPDLYPVLNVLISTPVFVLVWLWSIKCGVEVGWALGGWGGSSNSSRTLTRSGVQHGERKVSEDTSGVAAGGPGSASVSVSGGSEASAPGLAKRRTARRGSIVLSTGGEE